MKRVVKVLVLLALTCSAARAELTIEITRGIDQPVPIAVVPFGWKGGVPGQDVANIVASDLHRSGQFAPLPSEDMLSTPHSSQNVYYRDWRSLAVDYVVVGQMESVSGNRVSASFELMDVHRQKVILKGTMSGNNSHVRDIAHEISNQVYEKLTNIKGAFNTKLLYVSALRGPNREPTYRLLMSDIDGAREKVLREQNEPIMTPTWSPDGKTLAYVSFETSRPAIYLHNVDTGQRKQLTRFKGINGSPAWAPDGKRLAMVLSKDGNPDIYVMDLETYDLKQLTRHFAIDTEPDWMPDGKSIIFTSDRGGKPQIYKVTLATGNVERLTFEGSYNARARILPGGQGMIMVHRSNGKFRIALQDFRKGDVIALTDTALDESPSVAPNGTILLYATKRDGKGVLAAVSVDGDVQYYLPSKYGDVREPAWSPFLDAFRITPSDSGS